MAIVSLVDISKTYKMGQSEVHALQNVSLKIDKGEFLAVAGSSGSGKTTMLNMIGCLDYPDSGKVCVDGADVTLLKPNQLARLRNRKIGFIFQSFNLIPVLNVYENIELPLLLSTKTAKEREKLILKFIDAVGLGEHIHHKPDELSGGQRQRVAIARALTTEPDLVLADEPTANLDSKTGMTIIDLMLELNQHFGTTFIFSTHDSKVLEHASRVVNLEDGRIINQLEEVTG